VSPRHQAGEHPRQAADPNLRGSQMRIKLADFNVGKVADPDVDCR
jgi:hypothetical protein